MYRVGDRVFHKADQHSRGTIIEIRGGGFHIAWYITPNWYKRQHDGGWFSDRFDGGWFYDRFLGLVPPLEQLALCVDD